MTDPLQILAALVGLFLGVPVVLLGAFYLRLAARKRALARRLAEHSVPVVLERGGIPDGKNATKETILVPRRVNSWEALRDALKIRPGHTVAFKVETQDGRESWSLLGETEGDVPGRVVRWWEFASDHEYWEVPLDRIGDLREHDEDDDPADHWKRDAS